MLMSCLAGIKLHDIQLCLTGLEQNLACMPCYTLNALAMPGFWLGLFLFLRVMHGTEELRSIPTVAA